eukprot:TRINITY_DN369_c0_g1_i1.p1 TRINITY_DN369_c0_g1~~TRINITY_DN369_c0_g1_i1.p1  ORF type:complete len:341 (+),score=52.59 TRINITY_DN369_c0_g1_i1:225-1247(+)
MLSRCSLLRRAAIQPTILYHHCKTNMDTLSTEGRNLKVMSFNLRTDTFIDSIFHHSWIVRREKAIGVILTNMPDIICTQEGLITQLHYIHDKIGNYYSWFGEPRASSFSPNEYCAIFYRKDKFELLEGSTFWLSDTPSITGSVFTEKTGFISSMYTATTIPRIATWGKFRYLSSKQEVSGADKVNDDVVCVVSTHWSLSSHLRMKTSDVFTNQLEKILGPYFGKSDNSENSSIPVIVGGDFNEQRYSKVWQKMNQIGWEDAWLKAPHKTGHESPTFHGFMGKIDGYQKGSAHIDWILFNGGLKCLNAHVLNNLATTNIDQNEKVTHASDHYPIIAEFIHT